MITLLISEIKYNPLLWLFIAAIPVVFILIVNTTIGGLFVLINFVTFGNEDESLFVFGRIGIAVLSTVLYPKSKLFL